MHAQDKPIEARDDGPRQHLITALETYHDLNPSIVEELDEDPSPLEFIRFVSRNRPFINRGGARSWPAYKKWNKSYLLSIMSSNLINVATTPHGNADSVLSHSTKDDEPEELIYIEPHQEHEPFSSVLSHIQSGQKPVKYLQTQNDNLRNEYSALFADVPSSIPFARIALAKDLDAVNFWLGDARSVTSLHRDNYENIYAQIRGQKHFVLLPPLAALCVNERTLPRAVYTADMQPKVVEPREEVPVPIWDPDEKGRGNGFEGYARPMRITLNEGDVLYLPALWYHKVSQTPGEEGFCCSVNYWYDMEFGGQFWATNQLVRGLALDGMAERGG